MKLNRLTGGIKILLSHKPKVNRDIDIYNGSEVKYFPVAQHVGAKAIPCVKVGDKVKVGKKIAGSDEFISAPIHSSVSGEVVAIKDLPTPRGGLEKTIVVLDDRKNTREEYSKYRNWNNLDKDIILHRIKDFGIVGLGGACFPTHVKLGSSANLLIINGVECEPYLETDTTTLLKEISKVIEGIQIVKKITKASRCVVAVKKSKKKVVKGVVKELERNGIEVAFVKDRYPQGGEKQLIEVITGDKLEDRELPINRGIILQNLSTIKAIYDATVLGFPLTHRTLTIGGDGIKDTKLVRVPIGTPIDSILSHFKIKANDGIILGGPMMGKKVKELDLPIIKGISGLLNIEEKDHCIGDCIKCGKCVDVCPMGLAPVHLKKLVEKKDVETLKKHKVNSCVSCGACTYVCPAKLPLCSKVQEGKRLVGGRG